jgi:hypothetical protein
MVAWIEGGSAGAEGHDVIRNLGQHTETGLHTSAVFRVELTAEALTAERIPEQPLPRVLRPARIVATRSSRRARALTSTLTPRAPRLTRRNRGAAVRGRAGVFRSIGHLSSRTVR